MEAVMVQLVASVTIVLLAFASNAAAQTGTEIRYPDGTVVQPVPVVPSVPPPGTTTPSSPPSGSVVVTSPAQSPAAPTSRDDNEHASCETHNYAVAPGSN